MDFPEQGPKPLEDMLKRLEDVRDRLAQANEALGFAARVNAIRKVILTDGWDGILARYHPDVNDGDPAAYPLFELCRFVYGTMK
jgi:hypothetical protein